MGKKFIHIMKKLKWRLLASILTVSIIVFSGCNTINLTYSNSTESTGVTTESTGAATESADAATATGNDYELRNKSAIDENRGVYYEIFVRSFADSDGDGIGDFNGVTAKLDYLQELGIEGIWLMPINESPSYHGYDVTDYTKVNPDYGTEEDFANLLSEAHDRGIKIIMDFVVNHTSDQHPWFVASANGDSEYRDYYQWVTKDDPNYDSSDRSPWGSNEWHSYGSEYYFAMFYSGMPDLNFDNESVRAEIKEAAAKWLEMGVDGFRLDAAMHIYGDNESKGVVQLEKNLEWWNEFAIACEEINPDVYLVGEAWQESEVLAEYAQPFNTKFYFAFEENLMEAVINKTAMVSSDGKSLAQSLEDNLDEHYAVDENFIDGVFGTNHDQNRIMSQVATVEQAKLVANIYLTLDGNPYIYYGEEIGMYGSKPDENIREPFKWTADGSGMDTTWEDDSSNNDTIPLSEQLTDSNSMYSYYKNLIAIRKANTALVSGTYEALSTDNEAVMAYSRSKDDETIYILHNLSDKSVEVEVSDVSDGEVLFNSNDSTKLVDKTVMLDRYSSIIIKK